MDQALAGHVIEILASMSIEDVRTVVAEIEAFMGSPGSASPSCTARARGQGNLSNARALTRRNDGAAACGTSSTSSKRATRSSIRMAWNSTLPSPLGEAEFSARELLANAIRSNVPPPIAIHVADRKDREVAVVRLAELVRHLISRDAEVSRHKPGRCPTIGHHRPISGLHR